MFYMQARWYDPGAGRFLSVDPLIRSAATPQSANPYSYTENNPVNGIDPTGESLLWSGSSGRLTGSSYDPSDANGDGEGGDVKINFTYGTITTGDGGGSIAGEEGGSAGGGGGGAGSAGDISIASRGSSGGTNGASPAPVTAQSGNAGSADAQEAGGRNQTVWGGSGTYGPGEGTFSGSDYLTAVLPRGPNLGYTEAGFGVGPFQGLSDALGDVFVGMMLHLGSIPIAIFGHGVGFFLHLPVLPFRFGQSASRNWHEAVKTGRFGALDAGVGRFRSAGDTLIRQLPRQIRNDFFSGE